MLGSTDTRVQSDGRYLLFNRNWGDDLRRFDLTSGETSVVVEAAVLAHNGQFSPDGRWLAYSAEPNGERQVYVEAFPAGGTTWQVSRAGGDMPRWSTAGRELFFRRPTASGSW